MTNYAERLGDDTYAIFLFHGIYWKRNWTLRNGSGKHIEYARFRDIVWSLKKNGTPVSMVQILLDDIPPRAFAITWDDGFASSYWLGASYLEELQIPATFYITTGFVENASDSWVDQIERVAEQSSWPPEALNGAKQFGKHSRIDQYAIADFAFAHGAACKRSPQLDYKMDSDMVADLAANPLFTIGGHSVSHRNLEYLPHDLLRKEIEESTRKVRDWTGEWSHHYSYPEGMPGCNKPDVVEMLKNQGVKICPTAQDGVNRRGDDLFALKRIMVV